MRTPPLDFPQNPLNWQTFPDIKTSKVVKMQEAALPPMLLPQASRVRPSTVLLRLKTTPNVLNRLTTSVAAVFIHIALTRKPSREKSCSTKKNIM